MSRMQEPLSKYLWADQRDLGERRDSGTGKSYTISETHGMQEKSVLEKSILWLEAVSSELAQSWAQSRCSVNVNI